MICWSPSDIGTAAASDKKTNSYQDGFVIPCAWVFYIFSCDPGKKLCQKRVKWLLLETLQINDGIGAEVKRSQACVPELGGELLGPAEGLVLHLGRSRLKFSYDSDLCPTQGRYLFLSCTKALCGVAPVGLTLPHLLNLGCVTHVKECLLWPFGNHHAGVSVVNSSCQCWSEQQQIMIYSRRGLAVTQQICLLSSRSREVREWKRRVTVMKRSRETCAGGKNWGKSVWEKCWHQHAWDNFKICWSNSGENALK